MLWSLCGLDVGKFFFPNFSRSRHTKLDHAQLVQNRVLEGRNCWAFMRYGLQSGFEVNGDKSRRGKGGGGPEEDGLLTWARRSEALRLRASTSTSISAKDARISASRERLEPG